MAGLLAIALVVALGLFGFGKQAVAPAPAVIAHKADMGGESSESGEIYLGDVNREFLPGHVVVLKKLMQVSVYLLNHSVVIKTVTLPELGERGFGYKHKYVQFATFRNEMAFYRHCVPAMLAPPWELNIPRPLKLLDLGPKLVMAVTPMFGDFGDKVSDLTNDTAIIQLIATYHAIHWHISPSDLRVRALDSARDPVGLGDRRRLEGPRWPDAGTPQQRLHATVELAAELAATPRRQLVDAQQVHTPEQPDDLSHHILVPDLESTTLHGNRQLFRRIVLAGKAIKKWMAKDEAQQTLVHGDAHRSNFAVFRPPPAAPGKQPGPLRAMMIDFQYTSRGPAGLDVAFFLLGRDAPGHGFVTMSHAHENELLTRYHEALVAGLRFRNLAPPTLEALRTAVNFGYLVHLSTMLSSRRPAVGAAITKWNNHSVLERGPRQVLDLLDGGRAHRTEAEYEADLARLFPQP